MSFDTAGYWYGEGEGHRCGYCQNETTNISTGLYLSFISPRRYNALIDRGWRRSGMYMYKPSMEKTCCPQYTIKCNALLFRISRSQKKVLRHFIEYLENSEPGSLPSRGRGQMSTDVTDVANDHHEHPSLTHNVEISPDVKPTVPVDNGKPVSHHVTLKTSAASSSAETTGPQCYKTGAQLADSKKKRDFRRLRKLKKIAAEKNLSWEEMDVRSLGSQPDPPSLSDRLSRAIANKRLEIKLIPVDRDNAESEFNRTFSESHKVFQKYQMAIHKDTPDECKEQSYKRFLCQPPFNSEEEDEQGGYHHQYFIDGKLVAVGVLDLLPRCLSSVYFFYDPDYGALSFGTLSALFEIQLTQQMNSRYPDIEWYYMGYYIHTCPKMKYKSKFYPSYLTCPKKHTWWPIEECEKRLDENKLCVFDEKTEEEPVPTEEELGTLKVLLGRSLCLYSVYKMMQEEDDYKDILVDFVKLAGLDNARNICIYH